MKKSTTGILYKPSQSDARSRKKYYMNSTDKSRPETKAWKNK